MLCLLTFESERRAKTGFKNSKTMFDGANDKYGHVIHLAVDPSSHGERVEGVKAGRKGDIYLKFDGVRACCGN